MVGTIGGAPEGWGTRVGEAAGVWTTSPNSSERRLVLSCRPSSGTPRLFLLAQIPPNGDAQKFLETLEESSLVDALVGSVTQNLLDVVVDLLLLVIGLGDLSHLLSFANLFLDKFDQGKC